MVTKLGTKKAVINSLSSSLNSREERVNNCTERTNAARKRSAWWSASADARKLVNHMRKVTPIGAAAPWRAGPSVTPFDAILADGVDFEEVVAYVSACAELVRAGVQPARYWNPANLFGAKTMPHWQADAAALAATRAAAQERQVELEAMERARERETLEAMERASQGPVVDINGERFRKMLEDTLSKMKIVPSGRQKSCP